jgi:hypothetical protein
MKAAIVIAFLFGVLLGLILRRFVSSGDPVSEEEAKKKAQAAAAATTTLKAEFFTDCNFKGKTVALGPGQYKNSEVIGLGNDSISSVKVPKGLSVTLYQDNDFKGSSTGLGFPTKDVQVECLTGLPRGFAKNWNDQISSIIIKAL